MDHEEKVFIESQVDEDDEISLLDLSLILARNRWLIAKAAGICLCIGLLIAIFHPAEYTAQASVIRETGENSSATGLTGLAALRGLGISLGSATTGITVDTYPEIIRSREVRLLVANSPIYFDDINTTMSLVEYQHRPPGIVGTVLKGLKNVTIGLPNTLRNISRKGLSDLAIVNSKGNLLLLSKEEEVTIRWLAEQLSIKIDRASGIMTIAVTTNDPLLSAQLAITIIDHLKERVQEIYTQKTHENVEFIRDRFAESQNELVAAEEELARFTDRNLNPQTARLKVELDRLKRIVTFKTQLHSDLQTQLTQAEIELQRSQPVITLVESPVPPLKPSGPRRMLTVIFSLFLGGALGTAIAGIKNVLNTQRENAETSAKLAELRDLLNPKRMISWRRRL
jgi:uncharacterized protein involved in exopolysaccharide biosynthesis